MQTAEDKILIRVRGCRPAAILLHTPEADAALLRAADELGVVCREVPPLKALRESLRSFWDSVSWVKTCFVTKEAAQVLRHIPTLCRRMVTLGQLCPVDSKSFAGLVEKHCLDATSIDVWRVRPAAASAEQDTNASSSPVDKLQTESRHSTGGVGFPERLGSGLYH